jgi:hypothetical protein
MHTPVPQSVGPDDPAREAVLRAATEPVDDAFGDRARVEVVHLNRIGSWVFLKGNLRGADGGPLNYAGTAYEARRADGVMSDVYAVLLRKADAASADDDARSWRLSDYAMGPTDVAWLTWPDKHEAPRELFGV